MTQVFANTAPDASTIGAFVTIILAFLGVAKIMLGQATKDREADRKERIKLSEAIGRMADSNKEIAKATRRGADEAKQRNGHLGEQNIQIARLVTSQNSDVSEIKETNKKIADILSKSAIIAAEDRDILLAPGEQHIEHQTVEIQEVKVKK